MPGAIKSLTNATLSLECYQCGEDREVAVADLLAGVDVAGSAEPDCIVLPKCACGAVTSLFRTRDTDRTGRSDLVCKLINRLHARLKAAEQTCTGFPDGDEDATNVAPDDDTISVVA